MNIQISIAELGTAILWLAAVVLLVYLILLAKNALSILKSVSGILKTNEENIENSMNEIPNILHNVDEITGEVSHDIKSVRATVDTITEKSIVAADSLENIDSIIAGVTTVIQSGIFLKDLYSKSATKK